MGRESAPGSRLLQRGVEAVEDGHAAVQQLVVLVDRRRQAADGQIDARGLRAGEFPVVQVGFVHDLRDGLEAPVS